MGAIRDFIDFIKDALWISKLTIASPWLWLMIAFGVYITLMPWMMFAIHPLSVLIVPAILIVYLIVSEDKRLAAQYSLKKKDGSTPGAVHWNVKKSVDEYMQLLNKRTMILTPDQGPDEEEQETSK
jgi:hypothetical protein